jgi:hypothetical protein
VIKISNQTAVSRVKALFNAEAQGTKRLRKAEKETLVYLGALCASALNRAFTG